MKIGMISHRLNRVFAAGLPKIAGVHFLDPYEALTRDDRPLFLIDGKIIHSDGLHLSLDGSVAVIRHFRRRIQEIMDESKPGRRVAVRGRAQTVAGVLAATRL